MGCLLFNSDDVALALRNGFGVGVARMGSSAAEFAVGGLLHDALELCCTVDGLGQVAVSLDAADFWQMAIPVLKLLLVAQLLLLSRRQLVSHSAGNTLVNNDSEIVGATVQFLVGQRPLLSTSVYLYHHWQREQSEHRL